MLSHLYITSAGACLTSHCKFIRITMELVPVCSYSFHSSGFLQDFERCLWKYMPFHPEEHLQGLTLMMDDRGRLTTSILVDPKGGKWG